MVQKVAVKREFEARLRHAATGKLSLRLLGYVKPLPLPKRHNKYILLRPTSTEKSTFIFRIPSTVENTS